MSNLSQLDITQLCSALCRPPALWIDIRGQPSARLMSEEADRIIRLPARVLQYSSFPSPSSSFALLSSPLTTRHPSSSSSIPEREWDPNTCLAHARISHALVSSLSARILHEAALKLPLLDAAVAAVASLPKPGRSGRSPPTASSGRLEKLKRKHIKSLMRLQKSYKKIYAYLLPRGAGRGAHVGGCEACFVAAFGGCEDALFALRTGARVWRRDRSAVARYVTAWFLLLPADVRRRLERDIPHVAHGTRQVLRAVATAAVGDGGSGGGGTGGTRGGGPAVLPTPMPSPTRTISESGMEKPAEGVAMVVSNGRAGGQAAVPVLEAHCPQLHTMEYAGWEELPTHHHPLHHEVDSGGGCVQDIWFCDSEIQDMVQLTAHLDDPQRAWGQLCTDTDDDSDGTNCSDEDDGAHDEGGDANGASGSDEVGNANGTNGSGGGGDVYYEEGDCNEG